MAFNTTLKHFTSSQELAPLWATAQNYLLNQLVLQNDVIYRCAIAHTSSVFATDLGAGKWVAVSAAGAQGSKNYIANSDFEDNNTTGWSLFNTTIDSTTKIPSGSVVAGAAGFNALSVASSSPLAGTYSLSVSTPAGVTITTTAQGFISDAFTIDREDQAKVMGFSFYYEAVSGTMNFSGTSANTFAVYIRDVSGGSWIQPAGVYNMTQGSGIGLCSGTFQTTATGTQYQIAVMMINTVSAGVSLKFDDFQLGPQKVVYGSPVTDWEDISSSVTLTNVNIGTTGTKKFSRRRVGDSYEIAGTVEAGGSSISISGIVVINLPFIIDTTKINASQFTVLGSASFEDAGSFTRTGSVIYSSTTSVLLATPADLANATNPAAGWFAASGDQFSVIFTVPVVGLSSSVSMSQDTDTRVVAARIYKNGPQALGSGETKLTSFTVETDRAGMWDSVNNRFNIPVSGDYRFTGTVYVSPFVGAQVIAYRVNGSLTSNYLSDSSATDRKNGSALITGLKAGDYVEIYHFTGTSGTVSTGTGNTYYSLERLSGPATIAASETVACSYNTSTSVITGSGAWSLVTYTNKVTDTHSIYNTSTGIATIPVSGVYRITHQMRSKNAMTGGQYLSIHFTKNGTSFTENQSFAIRTGATGVSLGDGVGPATWVGSLVAGDLIRFSMDSNSASNGPTTVAAEQIGNNFIIERLG